ncbi:MAG: TonB-dependent receptor plug domain-containing protein [Putridiphycobacter sp.]
MQLKIYILIFGCIFLFSAQSQTVLGDTLKPVQVILENDSILKLTVIHSNVPHYVLNQDKLNQLGSNDMGDALKFIPGTYIKDYGGIAGLKTISYRSLGAAHTAVQIDGVILPTTQTGVVNLSGLDVFSVQQAELSIGQPQDMFSTANAYVKSSLMQINSRLYHHPKSKMYISALGMFTNINSYQNGILFQQKLTPKLSIGAQGLVSYGNGSYPFTLQNVDSTLSATRQNTNLLNYNVKSAVNYNGKHIKLNLRGGYLNSQQQLPGAVVLYNSSNDQSLQKEVLHGAFSARYKRNLWAIGYNLFAQQSHTLYRDNQFLNQAGFIENHYLNRTFGSGLILNRLLKTANQRVFISTDFRYATLLGNQFNNSPQRLNLNSVMGLSKWVKRLKIQANVTHQFIHDVTPNNTKRLSHFSPFIALGYLPFKNQTFRVRAHYKDTYRLPTFNDLYYNTIGNKDLKAETVQSFNFGLTYGKKSKQFLIETTIDIYQNFTTNKIVAVPTKNLFNWSMQNVGKVLSKGIEGSFLIQNTFRHHFMSFSSSQHFNHSVDVTNEDLMTYGHQIAYTPVYTSNYVLTYGYKKNYFSGTILWVGERYTLNQNIPSNLIPNFVDISLGYNRTFNLKSNQIYINLQMVNILNQNYEVINSFPMPGRHFRLKLLYQLNT